MADADGGARVYGVEAVRRVPGGIASAGLELLEGGKMPRMTEASSAASPAPEGAHAYHHQVRAEEIDELGHVNNLHYVAWMQAAAADHSAAVGWPWSRYEAIGGAWVVRSHAIEYLRPAFAGDEIVVRTWVTEMGKIQSRRRYAICRADTVLARGETRWVFISRKTLALDRVPTELREAFPVLAGGG
ncbi:MAG: acyl-CoA thioesterase [Myxococcales bacterium]|nr:acyl-CoA thioesterase [Myxococcales bacterium]